MSRFIARWPLIKTNDINALAIVTNWKNDHDVISYLSTNLPNVAVLSTSNCGEANRLAKTRFGDKYVRFFIKQAYIDINTGKYHNYIVEHEDVGRFEIDDLRVFIETTAKWAVYPVKNNPTHTNFYFADDNPLWNLN